MARVSIDIPDQLPFSTELEVRITDINYGNHLANQAVMAIMHEARMRFLKHYGYSEMNLEGVSLIMSDSAIMFKGEAFYGEVLGIEVGPGNLERKGFDIFYRLYSLTSGRMVAIAKTGMVCFDYQKRRTQSLPPAFRQRFEPQP